MEITAPEMKNIIAILSLVHCKMEFDPAKNLYVAWVKNLSGDELPIYLSEDQYNRLDENIKKLKWCL